jgi:cytochrome P450
MSLDSIRQVEVDGSTWTGKRTAGIDLAPKELAVTRLPFVDGDVLVCGADYGKQILSGDVRYFDPQTQTWEKGDSTTIFGTRALSATLQTFHPDRGFTSADNQESWRMQRTELNKVLVNSEVLEKYFGQHLKGIDQFAKASGFIANAEFGIEQNMREFLTGLYFYIMSLTLLPHNTQYNNAGLQVNNAFIKLFETNTFKAIMPKLAGLIDVVGFVFQKGKKERGILREIIENAMATASSEGEKNLLTALMPLYEDGKLSESTLFNTLVEVGIFGAVNTSTSTSVFALTYLSRNKEVLQSLRAEIAGINLEDTAAFFAYCDREDTLLRKVLCETLRMSSPSPVFLEQLSYDIKIGDARNNLPELEAPAGTFILVDRGAMFHSQAWGNPEQFDPSRFDVVANQRSQAPELHYKLYDAKGNVEFHRVGAGNQFRPFGAGARDCIGQKYALQQTGMVVAYLLKNFEFEFTGQVQDLTTQLDNRYPVGALTVKASMSIVKRIEE